MLSLSTSTLDTLHSTHCKAPMSRAGTGIQYRVRSLSYSLPLRHQFAPTLSKPLSFSHHMQWCPPSRQPEHAGSCHCHCHCHCAQLELTPATCRVALKVRRRLRVVPASTAPRPAEDTSQGGVGLDGDCSGHAPCLTSLVSEGQCRSAACSRGARAKQVKRDPFAANRLPCG